jgi:3-hydroxyacyl-[acyl-carrier-protein] dehydratase
MRWFWIDRYTEFVSGQRATAVKNVSLAEDHLHDHFPGAPVMPNSLVLEGMAQAAGLLVGEHGGYEHRVILAKVAKAAFHFDARPGDTIVFRTEVKNIDHRGASVTGTTHVGERLQGEFEIFFAHLDDRTESRKLFEADEFLLWLKLVGMYEVGVKPDGTPIKMPQALIEADEKAMKHAI